MNHVKSERYTNTNYTHGMKGCRETRRTISKYFYQFSQQAWKN